MAMVSPVAAGDALDGLIAEQEAALIARTTRSHELHAEALHHLPGGVASSWQDAPPCPVFLERGARIACLGRRWHRVRRPARRVRHDDRRPRPSRAGRRDLRACRGRHALRPTGTRHHPGRRRAGAPLRAPAVAVHQLGDRGDARRDPPRPSGHRSLRHHQGRGQLPRPPRRGAGVRLSRPCQRRTGGSAASGPRARRGRTGHRQVDARRAVRSARRRAPRAARSSADGSRR